MPGSLILILHMHDDNAPDFGAQDFHNTVHVSTKCTDHLQINVIVHRENSIVTHDM